MGDVCQSLLHVRHCDIPWPANLAITQIRHNNCDEWRNCSLLVLLSPNEDTGRRTRPEACFPREVEMSTDARMTLRWDAWKYESQKDVVELTLIAQEEQMRTM